MSASQKFAHAEKIFKHSNAKSQIEKASMKKRFLLLVIVPLVFVIGGLPWRVHAQQKLLEKVRLTVPAGGQKVVRLRLTTARPGAIRSAASAPGETRP